MATYGFPLMTLAILASVFGLVVGQNSTIYGCSDPSVQGLPFCNVSLPLLTRVTDLVQRMTLEELLSQLVNEADAVSSLDVPAYNYWSEGLHGVLADGATSYPQVIGLGATFNTSLYLQIGIAISTEGRAFYQTGQGGIGGLNFFAPNINIYRDPRWGRGQETPGEDPLLSSEYVRNYVQGMQGSPWDPLYDSKYLKVSATCKHYDAYSLEDWGGVDRHHFDAIVEDYDFQNTYLPVFRACAESAGARSVMCSYNSVNGIPSCAHGLLQNTVMRGQWGWNGFIVSDCGAIDDIQNTHNYTQNVWDTCEVAFKGGCDLDCGSYYSMCGQAIEHNTLTRKDFEQSLVRVLMPRFELGLFDPPGTSSYESIGGDYISTPKHTKLALEAARQSMVLLSNDGTLPLSSATNMNVALIGPNANATITLLGNYYGQPKHIVSPLAAIEERGVGVSYAEGCDVKCNNTSGFDEAVLMAENADVVVLVMGIDQSIESEGLDRTSLLLPGFQNELIRQIAAAAAGPVVGVLVNGGQIDCTLMLEELNANVEAFYPGEQGGRAIADVLFGDYNPGGRLPYTIYKESYVEEVSMFSMRMRSNSTYPGRSYKYFDGEPVLPFGFGLSYTTFAYKSFESKTTAAGVSFRVFVENTGPVAGDDVVLGMYAPDQSFGLLQIMFAFQRVTLEPGEGTVVTLFLTAKQLKDAHAEAGHERSHRQCGRGAVRINGDALVLPVVTDCHRLHA